MKKTILLSCLLLVLFASVLPAPEEKAEKLKIDENGWEYQWEFEEPDIYRVFVDGLSCQFGIATAGEHADFCVGLTLRGKKLNHDGNGWETWTDTTTENLAIKKVEGAPKVDGFVAIESGWVGWNGDDDGSGYIVQEVDFSLLTPGGNEISTLPPFTPTDELLILGPSLALASVRYDDNDWDRDGQQFVVSMSAKEYLFATGEDVNYTTVTELKILAGGETYTVTGTKPVVKKEGAEKDSEVYIAIEPTLIEWDRDEGEFTGYASVTASLQLIGPSGEPIGEPVVATTDINIEPPPGGNGGEGSGDAAS